MLQYVIDRAIPPFSRLSRFCLTNPDYLSELSNRVISLDDNGNDVSQLSDEFTSILFDLRIGGAWKRTRRGRLKETELALCRNLKPRASGKVAFLDLGASDGVTTLEAVLAMRNRLGVEVRAYLADLHLWLLRYKSGPLIEYRARDGEPVMARIGNIGLRLAKHRHEMKDAVDPIARIYLEKFDAIRKEMKPAGKVPLINPLAQRERAITPIEIDCLEHEESMIGAIDAVRASNLLNHSYFTRAQLAAAIGHIHDYLRPGGCLIISRNNDSPEGELERGSVWLKKDKGFERIEDFGGGSEIAEIVDKEGNAKDTK